MFEEFYTDEPQRGMVVLCRLPFRDNPLGAKRAHPIDFGGNDAEQVHAPWLGLRDGMTTIDTSHQQHPKKRPVVILDSYYDKNLGGHVVKVAMLTTNPVRQNRELLETTNFSVLDSGFADNHRPRRQYVDAEVVFVLPANRVYFDCNLVKGKRLPQLRVINRFTEAGMAQIQELQERDCPHPVSAALTQYFWRRGIRLLAQRTQSQPHALTLEEKLAVHRGLACPRKLDPRSADVPVRQRPYTTRRFIRRPRRDV